LIGFDPIQFVNEILVIAVVAVLVVLAWKFRGRVLTAFTGDDRIHGTPLDFVWFTCFRCCGTCNGEFTRLFTRCFCCPRRVRGANLVKAFGQFLGITPYTVEIKNIVVGDLPWDKRADFYLNVECAANPPMMSSLAEDKTPKVVHFPEVITLRLRWSPLEQSVRISVKELNVLGSTELCQVFIPAMSILDWSDDPGERMKRFEMKPMDQGLERETPAWILMEFDQPTEARDLEHFHGNCSTVRTATRDGHVQDLAVATFKHEYTLLDATGHAIQEPLEEDLKEIACLRSCTRSVLGFCHAIVTLLIIAYTTLRSYVWSCYHNYRWLTIASMQNVTFPISLLHLKEIVHECKAEVDGTGAPLGVPCRPNEQQIMDVCTMPEDGGHFPILQPHPTALGHFLTNWAGSDVKGIPCATGICEIRDEIAVYDYHIVAGLCCLFLVNCLFGSCANNLIRQRKSRLQHQRAETAKQIHSEMLSQTKARTGRSPGP